MDGVAFPCEARGGEEKTGGSTGGSKIFEASTQRLLSLHTVHTRYKFMLSFAESPSVSRPTDAKTQDGKVPKTIRIVHLASKPNTYQQTHCLNAHGLSARSSQPRILALSALDALDVSMDVTEEDLQNLYTWVRPGHSTKAAEARQGLTCLPLPHCCTAPTGG